MMAAALRDGVVDTVLTCGLVANVMLVAAGVDIGAPSLNSSGPVSCEKFIDRVQSHPGAVRRTDRAADGSAYVKDGERVEIDVVSLPVTNHLSTSVTRRSRVPAGDRRRRHRLRERAGRHLRETGVGVRHQVDLEAMAASDAFSALGGGDSVTAMNRYGLADRFGYVCTAGGAMVQFMSGKPMRSSRPLKGAAARAGA